MNVGWVLFFAFANTLGIVKLGFEQNYTVVEDAGVLEVCVILTSSINCSLNPIVATIDGESKVKWCIYMLHSLKALPMI